MNLTVYSRVNPLKISREEYEGFQANDAGLALKYGTQKELFNRNHAEIAWELVE